MRKWIDTRSLGAFFFREMHAALLNRFLHFFCGLSLLAGLVPLVSDIGADITETTVYILLQICLYLVPLFATLIGVGSAQSEIEESPFLMSQPVGRGTRVVGKFAALWLILAMALLLLVLPAALAGSRPGALVFLWLHGIGIGGVFASIGLAIGFSTGDRVKANMIGLCSWFIFLAGFDLLALAGAQTALMRNLPQLWLALLMINPLDALRVSGLILLDQIPFDAASAPPLGRWWISNLAFWFGILSTAWILLSLAWARARLDRTEF